MSSSISSNRKKGLWLTLLSTVWISPDALFVLFLQENDVPEYCIICWKFIFAFIAQLLFALVYLGGVRKYYEHLMKGGKYVLVGAFCGAVANISLSLSFMYTTSANALILFSLHVVWSSVLGWFFLNGECVDRTRISLTE